MDLKVNKNENNNIKTDYSSETLIQKENEVLSKKKGIFDDVQESSDEMKPIIIIDSTNFDEETKEKLQNGKKTQKSKGLLNKIIFKKKTSNINKKITTQNSAKEIEDIILKHQAPKTDINIAEEITILSNQKTNKENEQKTSFEIKIDNKKDILDKSLKISEDLTTKSLQDSEIKAKATASSFLQLKSKSFKAETVLKSNIVKDFNLDSNKKIMLDAESNATLEFNSNYNNSNSSIDIKSGVIAKIAYEDIMFSKNTSNLKLKTLVEQQIGIQKNYNFENDKQKINPTFATNITSSLTYSPNPKWTIETSAGGKYTISALKSNYSINTGVKATYKEISKNIHFGASYTREKTINSTKKDSTNKIKIDAAVNLNKDISLYSSVEGSIPDSDNTVKNSKNNKMTFGVKLQF